MKLQIQAAALASALGVAERAVGHDRNIDILSMVLLAATPDGGLTVAGTDLKSHAERTVVAAVERAGMICLPPGKIRDMLSGVLASAAITIDTSAQHKAVFTSGRTLVRIPGRDPEEFPATPSADDPSVDITLWVDTFRDIVQTVAFAAATDDSRPSIAGVRIESHGDELHWIAADGFRAARRIISYEGIALAIIVPAARLKAVTDRLGGARGDVRLVVTATRSHLMIESDAGRWAIKLIEEASYPDLSRAFAGAPTGLLTVNRDDLHRACKLVANVTTDIPQGDGKTTQATKARLTIGRDSLEVRGGDPEADHEAVTAFDAVLEGDPTVIALSTPRLRDALDALPVERVTLELGGYRDWVALRDAAAADRSHLHLMAPMVTANVSLGRAS